MLANERELQTHILRAHRNVQTYLKLNGEVLHDVHYTDDPVETLVAVTMGDVNSTLSIFFNQEERHIHRLLRGAPVELSSEFTPRITKGTVRIVVAAGQYKREFTVYCRTRPDLDIRALDEAVFQLQSPLLEKKQPEWEAFQRGYLHDNRSNVLEKRYLAGFYTVTS